MKNEFKIVHNGNRHIPRLSLVGVFDATAAGALVTAIRKEKTAERIIIHTNCLTMIMSGATQNYSEKSSEIGWLRGKLVFCGEHAFDIAPPGAMVIY